MSKLDFLLNNSTIYMKFGCSKCSIPVQAKGSVTNATDFVLPTAPDQHNTVCSNILHIITLES